MRAIHRIFFVVLLASLLCFSCDSVSQSEKGSRNANFADPDTVRVNVLVTDSEGGVVTGLGKENFRVTDAGIPQDVVSVTPSSSPMTVVILAEYSSHSYGYFADKVTTWASRFLDELQPTDWVALITFDIRSRVLVDFTHRRYDVRDTLNSLGPPQFSEANLFDALVDTLDKLEGVSGRKSIVLFTTGANTFSSATQDEVLDRIKATEAAIFCVGVAEGEAIRYGSGGSYVLQKVFLEKLADSTGGLAFFPRFQGELPDIFGSVAGFLRNEYLLSFRPSDMPVGGSYHKLRIEVVGSDGKPLRVKDEKGRVRKTKIYAREGYVAPALPPSPSV